jgi:hypothetical protein
MSNDLSGNVLPPELEARVHSELRPGERLVWTGQPRPGRLMRQTIPLVIFAIPWTAFSLFWMFMAGGLFFVNPGGGNGFEVVSVCFSLFGVPFVLIGFAMLASPWWAARKGKRTCYAITDRRAILWEAGWWSRLDVRSYEPGGLGRIVRTEYADGCGDLVFEEIVSYGRDSDGNRTSSTIRHGFMAVENVREVEDLLRKTLLSG